MEKAVERKGNKKIDVKDRWFHITGRKVNCCTYLFRIEKADEPAYSLPLIVDLGELKLEKEIYPVTVETTVNEMLPSN